MKVITINNYYNFEELSNEAQGRAIVDYRKNIDWSIDDYVNAGIDYVAQSMNSTPRIKADYSHIVLDTCNYDEDHGELHYYLKGKRALTYIYNNYVNYWTKKIYNGNKMRYSNCTKLADIKSHSNKIVRCLHTALLLFEEGLKQGKQLTVQDYYRFVNLYLNQYVGEAIKERSTDDFIINEITAREMYFTSEGELYC